VEPVEVIGGQERGERIEILLEGRGVRTEADPHESTPAVDPHPAQPHVRRDRVELLTIDDFDERSVQVVAPGVIATTDAALGETAGALSQPGAAVETGVVEGSDGLGVGADDEDGLVADEVLAEVADVGDLLLPAGHLPDTGPQSFELQGRELGARIASAGYDVVLADQDAVEVHDADLPTGSARGALLYFGS
jgi:hypothetical protein